MKKILSAAKMMLTLKCEESTRIVSDSLDRDLSWVERWAVRLHYISCWSCRRFGKHIRLIRETLQRRTGETTDPSLSPNAVQRIRDAIDAE